MILCAVILSSCSTDPDVIRFGKDNCDYCMMTIMDRKFGAELVNTKGRKLKFDSGECMLRYTASHKDIKVAKTFIINYTTPEELIDAEKAVYLHGGNVNSPMGGKLAAFKTKEDAEKNQGTLSGDELQWNDLLQIVF